MLNAITAYLSEGLSAVFSLFGDAMGGGIALFWNATESALTSLGEIMLLTAIVGLVVFGIKFIRSAIPFVKWVKYKVLGVKRLLALFIKKGENVLKEQHKERNDLNE